jgi:ATP-dependent Clp protease ATP-binding subunit ClpC
MEKISPAVFIASQLGGLEARNILRQDKIEKEHVFLGFLKLLGLSQDDMVSKMGIPLDIASAALEEIREIKSMFEKTGVDVANLRWLFRSTLDLGPKGPKDEHLHRSDACKKMFDEAEVLRQYYQHSEISIGHILLGILGEAKNRVIDFLTGQKMNVPALIEGLKEKLGKAPGVSPVPGIQTVNPPQEQPGSSLVSKIGRNLTELARAKKLSTVIGRDQEIKSIAQTLARKKKNSAILIGDPGVGKTAVVEGLAQKLANGELTGEELKGIRIVEIRMGEIMAGTKYRGDLEEKLMTLLKEAEQDRKLVVFLDEIHTIMQASGGAGAVGVADILKPAIQSGEFRCIGATTFKEYKKYIESDPALERRFQPVIIKEPTRDEGLMILSGLRASYERHHGIQISDKAIEAAVDFSVRYLPDTFLPDKALDLLDEAAAMLRIHSIGSGKYYSTTLEVPHIAEAVSKRKGIPLKVLLASDGERVRNIKEKLSKRIIGQSQAIEQVSAAITEVKTLGSVKNKPAAIFLFAGATGTGKTEMAKALAEILFEGAEGRLLSFDMSEYMEEHSVSKLIGAPPGYIGYEAGGQLVEQVKRYPYSVILFDEIEKAHAKVFDVFLQIFDEARLTDSAGRRADFQNAFIIMTSNIGSQVRLEGIGRPIGIQISEPPEQKTEKNPLFDRQSFKNNILAALQGRFRPEFLGRLPHKIVFFPLEPKDMQKIITTILLPRIEQRFAAKGVHLKIVDLALEHLIAKCDATYGVRNLAQLLDNEITRPLTEAFISGKFAENMTITIQVAEGRLAFSKE